MGQTVRTRRLRPSEQESGARRGGLGRGYHPPGVERHVDSRPLRASKYHCCRGLQPDRRRPSEGDNRGRHASRRAAAAVAVHRYQISGHAAELAFGLQQRAAGTGRRKDCTSLTQLMPVFLGMIPGLFLGVRLLLALNANVAMIIAGLVLMGVGGVTLLAPKLQLQPRLFLPAGVTFGFFGGILAGTAAMAGPLVFIFMLAKGLHGRAFTKEASLYLVVSSGLLALLLMASRQFSWLDVSVSTAGMLPVLLGTYVGQHMREKIAPETFKKLVLIAVIAAGADLLRHGVFS